MKFEYNTPHVDYAWVEAFIVELRLRGVSGDRIGAALAEIETHCADSGESAEEAFGPAAPYAASLALPRTETVGPRTLVESGLGLFGMLGLVVSVGSWRLGTGVEVTIGTLASLLTLVLGIVLIVRYAAPLVRQLVAHRWLAFVVGPVLVAVFVAMLLAGRRTLFEVPVIAVAALSALMLIANVIMSLNARPSTPVVSPEGAGGVGTQKDHRFVTFASKVGPFGYPIITALLCLQALFLTR